MELEPCELLVGIVVHGASSEVKNRTNTSGYVAKRIEGRVLRDLYTLVHSSTIYNSQKVRAMQASTEG